MNIAICDDIKEHRTALRTVLGAWALSKNITLRIEEYPDGINMLEQNISNLQAIDILFLDIYMPQTNGMEVARELRKREIEAPIVFLTTSSDFALEGYEVSALSYLIKPVSSLRVCEVMDRALQQFRPKRILLGNQLFMVDDIVFAESHLKIVKLHFKDGRTVEVREKLDVIANQLEKNNFLRCHKSFLVNLAYIARTHGPTFITTQGYEIPIRQRDQAEQRKAYFDYLKLCAGVEG